MQKTLNSRQESKPDSSAQWDWDSAPQWFAVYTSPRHEKSVSRHFDHREIESFLPLYKVDRKWSDGSRVTVELPLFTGYIFARIAHRERRRVLETPGAVALVRGAGGEPVTLPDLLIEGLRRGLAEHRVEPHPLLTAGQRVVIREGALAGTEGIVVRSKGGMRVVITVEQLQRSIAVEVSSADVMPVDSESLACTGLSAG